MIKTTYNSKTVTIARRLASQMWGEVQGQLKVLEGIWWIDCSGHGGFILDTNLYPEFKKDEVIVTRHKNSNQYYTREQYFAPFEEDCEYAKVVWLYPQVLDKFSKRYDLKDKTLEEWKEEILERVRKSLENWNPEFLEQYPQHR